MPSLTEMVCYADEALRIAEIEDYPHALNGLQIENSGEVTKIGAAVDASGQTMQIAVEREVDLLVVHHGLFWRGTPYPLVGLGLWLLVCWRERRPALAPRLE